MKKLSLNLETLRSLEATETEQVAGGTKVPASWFDICHTKHHCISKVCSVEICY